jgi:WD40 repeat protein
MLAISQRGIYLWNFAAGAVAEVLTGHEATAFPVFAPTGDLLASSSWDGTVRLWHPSGRQIASMSGNQVFVGRDGRLVVRHGTRLALLHVGQGPECRSLDDHGAKVFTQLLAIEPRSRVLVSAGATGIHLWDLARGSVLSRVPGNIHSVAFSPDGRHVLTAGPTQADRWPSRWHSDGTRLELGPPEKIATPVPRPAHWSVLSADARFLTATTSLQTAQVVDLKTGAVQCRLQAGGRLTRIAISADQRWAASGSWHGVEALVWDFRSGAVVRRFPHEFGLGHSYVAFSPNSNWFVLCLGSEYRLVEPGSWSTRWRVNRDQQLDLPGPVAFSPDGRLVALTRTLQVVTLVDLDTGVEVAQLSSPHRATIAEMCFSPDGRYLVAGGDNAIHVWDVLGIRRRLVDLGLDWGGSALASDDRPAMPVRVDLDLGALAPARK